MAIVPEPPTKGARRGLQSIAIGPRLGFRAWYRAARTAGWTRRAALRGARMHAR